METQTVLLTGARAPAALEWARQLARSGWRVLAADSMPRPLASWSRAVARTSRVPPARHQPGAFVEAVAEVCRAEGVDLVIPSCEEIFTLARGRHRLPAGTRLWAAGAPELEALHDKARFMVMAAGKGLAVPETRLMTSPEAVRALEGDWYLKPCYSRFAQTGCRWNPARRLPPSAGPWLSRQDVTPARPWVAQDYLDGAGWCSYAVVEQGRILDSVAYPVEWTAGAGACVAFRAVCHPGIEAWVQQFVQGSGFCGQLAFDFIEVPGRGVLPLECNPRATSGLHLRPDAAGRLTAALSGRLSMMEAPEPGRVMEAQLSLPMLLYGLPQALRSGRVAAWWAFWRRAPEVTSAPGDRWPAWAGNAWTVAWFAGQAARLRCGLTAATTADLEWNGPSEQCSLPE